MKKKNILIGVTGGIAAYKACDLVSTLSKNKNFDIKVMMTKNATQFVSPMTFEALSHHKVETSLFDEENEDPIAHISLATWADICVLVPATANIIAKVVHGIADDMVSTTFLACHTKKMICPAMNTHMYENEVTQQNLKKAKELGYVIVDPAYGHLACNVDGKGKLATVKDIVFAIEKELSEPFLKGKNILISAGPTQEALDPVRFISNHSSGKQGYSIARQAIMAGANVTIVSGPVNQEPIEGATIVPVTSAQDMFEAITSRLEETDYIIMAAAVADYRPEIVADHKIKKADSTLDVHFVKNPDILAYIGERKRPNQIVCGFAMETQDLDKNGREKLIKKNCDMLIANNLFTEGAGFKTDTNVVTLIRKDSMEHLPKLTKVELGLKILKTMKEIEEEVVSC
ncbi:MAG: bifunctional phosphopantothenoylcysteine decarboxylase/phosphopantothenate--cysteine ligase CoaBC [Bacillota bacterium]|nr:bifunctional phosphopantothenoylcysteine decarboxylase/phosphopantothenate--cysteine ligase CoaBC [Bacillota bacterium]